MNEIKENTNECKIITAPCATVNSQVQSLTKETPVTPDVISSGPIFAKIPVVLAEINITIPVEATITLDKLAMEIKRIKKNVFLDQSRIIPFSQDDQPGTGILFIKGFIRNNIEYATQIYSISGSKSVYGDIRHCTVEVPFSFTTRITFIREPVFDEKTTPSKLDFYTDNLNGCDDCLDKVIGCNPCDQSLFFTEFFNEKPFTELVRADIIEVDIHTNKVLTSTIPTEDNVTKLTEKAVVNLTLKVLQKQQVRITAL
ncbi:CsxC family protein [Clostridium tertium]